ncbi:hypothetical protein GCM10022199_01570 [Marihabitans asiaticum]|uniref:Protein kinase domain-containing protein n=1 Tax=Marihabitans asiaticum TaxID=415218 RepID=A0A560WFW9_9MICO|nr:hypothetical protein [Marihabitans asiaticum]TWD16567.1 hypothetical protein FB557_0090 [Marihabitans asiaticum]
MHGVHPGQTLGRYTLGERVQARFGSERWSARDEDLDRDVVVLVVPADHDGLDAALDAARRASGVVHPNLTRILDVEQDESFGWVVESGDPHDRRLSDLIGDGLPAEEVRRISGEAATALEAARRRGLHHLTLTPSAVVIGGDGSVAVQGLAVDAMLAGIDEEGRAADEADATAVVALAYAGLTGRWPLPGDGEGLEPAPRDAGVVVPPSHLVDKVPGDLDTLCREALAEDAGPDTPGEYASSVAPWSRMPLLVDEPALAGDDPPRGQPVGGPVDIEPMAAPLADRDGDGADEAGADAQDGDAADDGQDEDPEGAQGSTGRRGAAGVAAAAGVSGVLAGGGKALAGRGKVIAGGSRVIGERVGRAAQRTRDRAEAAAADRRAQREAVRTSESRDRVSLGSAGSADRIEAAAPLLPEETGYTPSSSQSRLVVGIMAAIVAVAGVLGFIGVSNIGSNTDLEAIFGSDVEPTAVKTTDPNETPSDGGGGEGGDAGGEPIPVLSAIGYDPIAGDGEHNAEAPRVFDGNAETSWQTEGYAAENMGNKPGVGLVLDLGQAQEVRSATLTLPTATTVQVHVGDTPGIESGQLGQSSGADGEITISADQPITGQYVTIWFTSTVQGDDGRHRASLAEVVLR